MLHRLLRSALRQIPGAERAYRHFVSSHDHWARVVMNSETKKLIESIDPVTKTCLEISGDSWRQRVKFASYKSVYFPEFDICRAPLAERIRYHYC
jgi:hypothetical protein